MRTECTQVVCERSRRRNDERRRTEEELGDRRRDGPGVIDTLFLTHQTLSHSIHPLSLSLSSLSPPSPSLSRLTLVPAMGVLDVVPVRLPSLLSSSSSHSAPI